MQPQRRAAAEALAVAAAQRRISGDLSTLDARVNETVDEVARFGVATDQQQRQRNGAQLRRVAPAASSHAAVNMSNDSITGSPLADNVSQSPLSPAPSPPLPMQHQSQHQHPHEHSLAANFKPAARPSVRVSVSLGEQSPTNASPAARVPPPDEQTEASIIVAVRCRPMSTKELSLGCENAVSVLEGKVVVLTDPTVDANNYYRKAKEPKSFQYAFDHAFDRDCGQRHVFERTTMCLVKPIMDGFNATAFAYGSTGAGKTHTMLGHESAPGIMALTLEALFQGIATRHAEVFKITVSFLEVYNECIRDLLHPHPNPTDFLELREDAQNGIHVAGISTLVADSAVHVMQLLQRGNRNRSTEPTAANKVSSRSHAVMQIVVEARDRLAHTSHAVRTGKLSLIDLAGSERASATQNSGLRMIEGANINRSLLALANCINALGEAQKSNVKAFVPYRDSKLTRLLKDSLGGNARTVMIANISPASPLFEETHNTLKYANRAKNIKTKITRNVQAVESHVANYQNIINELRSEVEHLRQQLQVSSALALGPTNMTVVSVALSPKAAGVGISGTTSPTNHSRNSGFRRASIGSAPPPPAAATSAVINYSGGGGGGNSSSSNSLSPYEQRELDVLRADLQSNFQSRLQLKRQLLDLEEMSLQQTIELNRRQVEIDMFESKSTSTVAVAAAAGAVVPKRIRLMRMEASNIRDTLAKHADAKDAIVKRLAEYEAGAQQLADAIPTRIVSSLARASLEMEIAMQQLQLQNLESEESALLQQLIIRQRDLSLKKMEIQLQLRDELIAEQKHQLRQAQPAHAADATNLDDDGTPRDEADDAKVLIDARSLKELHDREMKISSSLPLLFPRRTTNAAVSALGGGVSGASSSSNAVSLPLLPSAGANSGARNARASTSRMGSGHSASTRAAAGSAGPRRSTQESASRNATSTTDRDDATTVLSGASSLLASHPVHVQSTRGAGNAPLSQLVAHRKLEIPGSAGGGRGSHAPKTLGSPYPNMAPAAFVFRPAEAEALARQRSKKGSSQPPPPPPPPPPPLALPAVVAASVLPMPRARERPAGAPPKR